MFICSSSRQWDILLLLLLCGDIEPNPGPMKNRPEPKPDKNKIMQDKVEAHDGKIEELEALVKGQKDVIEELRAKQVELEKKLDEKEVESTRRVDQLKVELEAGQREDKVRLGSQFEGLTDKQVELGICLAEQKTAQEKVTSELQSEVRLLRSRLSGVDTLGSQSEDTTVRVKELEAEVDEILEKLWELDKSWRNNLVFYGIKSEGSGEETPGAVETKIRDIITKSMQISREIPIVRVKRSWNGPEVRGSRPVTVYFEKWQDRDEILRKGKMLKGSNIFVSEEFSKRVRDHRAELQKFAKAMVRKKRPTAKIHLQHDRLFVDNKEIYVFNELTGRVELLTGEVANQQQPQQISETNQALVRKKSSGRQRLQKSYSTESSLNNMSEGAPLYAPDSPRKSLSRKGQQQQNGDVQSRKRTEDDVATETEEEDDGLVDYTDVGSMSPIRRMNAIIPETIPE